MQSVHTFSFVCENLSIHPHSHNATVLCILLVFFNSLLQYVCNGELVVINNDNGNILHIQGRELIIFGSCLQVQS